MIDIVERMRTWTHSVHAVPVSDALDEAADEIERLRSLRDDDGKAMSALIDGYQKMQTMCIDGKYLTDAEREAVEWYAAYGAGDHAATLRSLLERLK